MLQNKLIIGIGALVFLTVATGFIMIGVQQRQTTRPNAQVTDTFSCPFGSTPPDPAGRCPSGFVPVPVYPTGGGQQSIGGTTSIGSGAFGGDGGDINPTGSINSPSPTPQVLGFCCMPLGQLTPTPTPFGEPTPTITPFVPNPPTPTSCPGGGEQLVVDSQTGCSATDRCDFSVTTDGSGNILTRLNRELKSCVLPVKVLWLPMVLKVFLYLLVRLLKKKLLPVFLKKRQKLKLLPLVVRKARILLHLVVRFFL
jgi:hypothetical protein